MKTGNNTKIYDPVNIYGDCSIGDDCMVGAFVEIQPDVQIGNRTRIQSHSFICSKVKIGNDCFIGHGVMFINDRYPPSGGKWESTEISDGVSIGSNATIMPVKIGLNSMIGAGSVVTKNVPDNCTVCGNPAKIIRTTRTKQ